MTTPERAGTPELPGTQERAGTPAGPLRAIVEALVEAGVRDVIVCPGSRSTPMALALRSERALRIWMHLDERAGAFFALGAAKATRRPVAMLATSGTAVVNFMPAIVEAHQGRVPLIVLTADRPPELRDRGAPQTIDQDHLYGRFAKWFAEVAIADVSPHHDAHVRSVVSRAVATAAATPAGAVHLNLPFREPLVPDGPLSGPRADPGAHSGTVMSGLRTLGGPNLEVLTAQIRQAPRGLIVCGPLDVPGFPDAVSGLAAATGYPVLADALSNVRQGVHDRSNVITGYGALLRSEPFRAAHSPELVLRFGAMPTSKALIEALQGWAAPQVVIDDGGWAETTMRSVTMVQAEPAATAAALGEVLEATPLPRDASWLAAWRQADEVATDAVSRWQASLAEPFEGGVYQALDEVLPDGAVLFAGNGMPVWDMDAFLRGGATALRCLGNRGANGIDGLVSCALGIAAMDVGPLVAVIGDISFIHDLNALVAARRHGLAATIVLVNNDGGGIFSFLPQARSARPDVGLPEHFEELFGTPHGLDLGALVRALGAEHEPVDLATLGPAVAASIAAPGVQVLELRTDRARNVALHWAATAAATDSIESLVAVGSAAP